MNSDQSEDRFRRICENGKLQSMLKKYICDCSRSESKPDSKAPSERDSNEKKAKKQEGQKKSFPNIAGFCRYLGISTQEFETLLRDFPLQYERLIAVFEDEALNSGLSPALLSAYLKKRIGYDSYSKQPSNDELHICFEHDVYEDGE